MPKMKTHKGSLSRFKVTATGKLKRNKQGLRHILTKKTSKRKRHLKKPGLVDSTMVKKYARMMGVVK